MEINEHQRMQKQTQSRGNIGQNDFLPQQAAQSMKVNMQSSMKMQGGMSSGNVTPIKRTQTINKQALIVDD